MLFNRGIDGHLYRMKHDHEYRERFKERVKEGKRIAEENPKIQNEMRDREKLHDCCDSIPFEVYEAKILKHGMISGHFL